MVSHTKYVGLTKLTKNDLMTLQQVDHKFVHTPIADQSNDILDENKIKSVSDSIRNEVKGIAPLSNYTMFTRTHSEPLLSTMIITYNG